MSICETTAFPAIQPGLYAGGDEPRNERACELWLIDHHGSTVLRCHCLESTSSGLRLRVPLGYGIGVGQRYEVRSHLPGQRPALGFDVIGSARITIVEARVLLGTDGDRLEVYGIRDPLETALQWATEPSQTEAAA